MNYPEIIYYLSFLSFITLIYFIKRLIKKKNALIILLIILNILFIYSRFIETQFINLEKTKITSNFNVNIALISDLHLWVWKNKDFLERVVEKINKENVDLVIIAWDFTFFPDKNDFNNILSPLKNLKVPIYAILWNHDVEKPWPKIRDELTFALKNIWVNLLNNEYLKFKDINIVWIWELWNNEAKTEILNKFSENDNVITIIHNPDILDNFTNKNSDLTLAWHTHWWQIRIPFLYKDVIPTVWNYDKWIYYKDKTILYISSWLWEVWLPMRFLNPPQIDILEVKKKN